VAGAFAMQKAGVGKDDLCPGKVISDDALGEPAAKEVSLAPTRDVGVAAQTDGVRGRVVGVLLGRPDQPLRSRSRTTGPWRPSFPGLRFVPSSDDDCG
jgi:hypothetical protein